MLYIEYYLPNTYHHVLRGLNMKAYRAGVVLVSGLETVAIRMPRTVALSVLRAVETAPASIDDNGPVSVAEVVSRLTSGDGGSGVLSRSLARTSARAFFDSNST